MYKYIFIYIIYLEVQAVYIFKSSMKRRYNIKEVYLGPRYTQTDKMIAFQIHVYHVKPKEVVKNCAMRARHYKALVQS